MAESLGINVKVGMDSSGFQSGVERLNRQIRILEAEFKEVSSKGENFGKTAEGLKFKVDSLSKQLELQQGKVRVLNEALKKSIEEKGQDAKATQELQIKVAKAAEAQNKLEQELKNATEEARKQSGAFGGLISKLKEVEDKAKVTGEKLSSIGRSMTLAITLPILAIGTASTKMAMDAVESENKFEVSMGKMAQSARAWSEEIGEALGLNSYKVRDNIATFNVMFNSMGIAEKKAYDMAKGLTQLSYDMASFYNLKPEEAFLKLQAGISGEVEPLKRLGMVLNEATVKAYALKHHIAKTGQEMTEQQKVAARYGLIMEQTSKAQGDLARTMDSPANQARKFKEQVEELSIKIGEKLLPIISAVLKVVTPIVEFFSNMNPGVLRFVIILGMMLAVLGPILLLIGNITKSIGGITVFLGSFNITGMQTTAIILGVVAALIALAAIIAVITGKTDDIEKTFKSIGSGVGGIQKNAYSPRIPAYATGTSFHPGGFAIVGEKGPEILNLPRGASVTPNNSSISTLGSSGDIYINVKADDLYSMADVVRLFDRARQQKRVR